MISFQLFLLTTLTVNVWSNLNSPVSFKYSKSGFLKLNIVLKNVPPDISQYLLHAKTDRHPLNTSRIYPKDGIYTIQCKLNVNYVAVDLEIKNNKASCAKLNILNGTRSTGVDGLSEFEQQCLMNYGEKDCSIEVDFKNTCTDSRLECNIKDKTLICFSGNIERSEVTWSQHYIEYKDRHFGLPTKVNGTSYMKMKIYKFDNNSEVSIKSTFSMKYYTVSIPVDEAEDYELETLYIDKKIITYTFTCRDDNSKVGVLYDNGSKLTIYANNIASWSRQSEPLNRYACCVQLKIYNKDDGLGIERIVNQFTHIRDKPTQEIISVKPMCTMEAGYTLHCKCMETQNYNYYKWSQFTAKNDEIGTKYQKIWSFQTKSSILKMLIYKFDNNTIIICEGNSQEITKHTNNNNNPIPKTFTIRIPGGKTETVQYNTLRAEGISEVISFSKSEKIKVNCSTNAYAGLIYHKEEIIERQNSTSFYIKNHSDISYRACCIYFESAGAYLIREIKNISLLVNIQTNDPVTPITTTSPVEPVSDNQDEVESTTSNLGLYIVLPTLLIVIILLLIIALRFKKRRNPRESQQMLQLETYGTTEKVLYAELALKPRNDHRVPVQTNESPYAEIVGVLNEHRGKPPQLNRSRAESRRT